MRASGSFNSLMKERKRKLIQEVVAFVVVVVWLYTQKIRSYRHGK